MIASAIKAHAVDWLWWPYIPLGKITTVGGSAGQAKSLWTAWLAAAVTQAHGITLADPGSVIMCNAEDDAADTIRPRLEAAGADLNKVWVEPNVILDADLLNTVCDDLGDVKLITIDPVQAYLPGNVNSWKGQEVRAALEPIRQLAQDRRLAVQLVQHLNRNKEAADPLARFNDSQAITQLCRSVLVWGADPSDPDGDHGVHKVLSRAKGNLARSDASASFTIVERDLGHGISAPTLERGADRQITADDVVSDYETRTAQDEAITWITALLSDGPVDAKTVFKRAREDGIAERTLKRAKRPAGVLSDQTRTESGISEWIWRLKDGSIHPDGPLGPLGPLGTVGPLPQRAKEAKEANNANGPARRSDDELQALIDAEIGGAA